MDILSIMLTVMLLIVALLCIFVVYMYNGLVRLQNSISKSWANIAVLLKQRSDEIPNLEATVKGYMQHERETLEKLTRARTEVLQASSFARKAQADTVISEALKTIFAVAEKYPELKANQSFLQLQQRITGLENELADRREFYNDCVMIYNIRIHTFPSLLVARMFHFTDKPLFKVSEQDKKNVRLNM